MSKDIKLNFLNEDEKKKVLLVAEQIKMPDENSKLHKKITAYNNNVIQKWNKEDTRDEFAQRDTKTYFHKPPFLTGVVSPKTLSRIFRLLNALFHSIEKLGGYVNDDLSLQIRNQTVKIDISEYQDVVDHVITKKEAEEIKRYEDSKSRGWYTMPNMRKHDYVFNGKIRVIVRRYTQFKDTDEVKVESMLGDILIELYELSEEIRIENEANELIAKKKQEEENRREELRIQYNKEVELTMALENEALDYERACKIRAYVDAIEHKIENEDADESIKIWIEWANRKADWFDPTIARNDELLGIRDHKKNDVQKVLKITGRNLW